MHQQTWTIADTEAGKRLDVFLSERISDLSRSAIAKKLRNGAGTVNGKTAAVHAFLKTGDAVSFQGDARPQTTLTPEKAVSATPWGLKDFKSWIVEETDDWILINKPAGLLVHPDSNHPHGTLVDFVLAYDPAIAKVGENPMRPGIVHRLDRDVSGLMLIAKTQFAYDELKRQFAQHQTQKTYLALAYGHLPKKEGEIKFRIARSKTKARMAARPAHEEEGKAAWTHYTVKQTFAKASLVELQIISGRTHQVRAHLHALGCPVIGDALYTQKPYKPIPSSRLMLQSMEIRFADPASGKTLRYSIAPDPSFKQMTASLKTSSES